MDRRSFLRLLGIGAVVGPSLVKVALKPSVRPNRVLNPDMRALASGEIDSFMGFKFVRSELPRRTASEVVMLNTERLSGAFYNGQFSEIWAREMLKRMNREKDLVVLRAIG